jgi:hypothetical protein
VYYGAAETGLMREGLQAWALTVVLVYAWVRVSLPLKGWEHSWAMDGALALRSVEVALMLLLPAWVTMRSVTTHNLHVTDTAALVMMIGGVGILGFEAVQANRVTGPFGGKGRTESAPPAPRDQAALTGSV